MYLQCIFRPSRYTEWCIFSHDTNLHPGNLPKGGGVPVLGRRGAGDVELDVESLPHHPMKLGCLPPGLLASGGWTAQALWDGTG